jgi:histone-lysine N-methyltransferase SETMAR
MSVTNPADCEVRSVIRFLNVKNIHPAEIHRQLVRMYGEGVMNEGNVHMWCHLFNGGRTDVHNEVRSGRPSSGACLLHDNAQPHTAEKTTKLEKFGWENRDHPAHSPDLAPSNFHLFPKMREFLGGKRMATDEEVKEIVTDWLNGLAANFYDEGIVRLVQCLDKCLNCKGDYIEK